MPIWGLSTESMSPGRSVTVRHATRGPRDSRFTALLLRRKYLLHSLVIEKKIPPIITSYSHNTAQPRRSTQPRWYDLYDSLVTVPRSQNLLAAAQGRHVPPRPAMRERAARRRPRRCSPLLLLVLLVMAATICYTYLILLRLRRQPQGNETAEADAAAAAARAADAKATAAIADAKARSAAEAAEAALTKDVEAFEQQHAEWVEGAANKHAAADDGVARAKRRRQAKAEQRALAAAETSGAAARPEEEQADGCSSDPAVGCMASPAVVIMSHDRADMLSRSLGLVCPMRMVRAPLHQRRRGAGLGRSRGTCPY